MEPIPLATSGGRFLAWYSPRGLARLAFPGAGSPTPSRALKPPTPVRVWHRATTQAVKQVLGGRHPTKLPPLDLTSGTAFQRAVWRALRRIKPGATRSYGEIARAVGSPGAARAVGQACGANPIPLLIPCHRVLAAGGRLGGFSGGLDWKRKLLAREGHDLTP
jgi:O-6-methylguanine DNA methyltransferase